MNRLFPDPPFPPVAANRPNLQDSSTPASSTVQTAASPPTTWWHRLRDWSSSCRWGWLPHVGATMLKPSHAPIPPPIPPIPPPSPCILVLGIHGWFPSTRIVQTVFGEPLGTSERFCGDMTAALHAHFQQRKRQQAKQPQYEQDYEIHSIPLTGTGTVQERVDKFLLQLQQPDNVALLARCTLLVMVTHSQGMPVSVILLRRLFRCGLVNPQTVQIHALCMAGIGHGPFPGLARSLVVRYVEADAARELFSFCSTPNTTPVPAVVPAAVVVKEFWQSLEDVLDANVKLTLVASWMDQVVPLHSALLAGLQHPNILRLLYIDHHNYVDDFLTRLVVFLVRLRNRCLPDYGLLRHLSDVLTGNLYGGTEHSSLYSEPKIYETAVQRMLEQDLPPASRETQFPIAEWLPHCHPTSKQNPNWIPWAMSRLILHPDIQQDPELQQELDALITSFQQWSPVERPLKELRYRLEPIQSRL